MKVTITNVKSVRSLEFDIPGSGVWVLAGVNGCGKSTLLAALYRIRNSYAFQQFFKTSPSAERIDPYSDASVTYEIEGESVTYRYGGQRWRAKPRAQAGLFEEFPYPTILYLEANSGRIEPFSDEIRHGRVRDAGAGIRRFMKEVLADDKWMSLKYVNTRRGVGNEAFLLPFQSLGRGRVHYFSEKSFSLGELCILRLAQRLSNVSNDSLILIDEIEMALHPQAQVRLMEKLHDIAHRKRLTVIFSTHSASIIKSAERDNLIGLSETANGVIDVIRKPYPAQLLGEVAFDDELSADFVFFVEDREAKLLLEQLAQEYLRLGNLPPRYQPLYKIVPVGGFVQVLEFTNASSQIFPNHVKRFAFLDADVRDVSLQEAQRNGDQALLDLFNRSRAVVNYLPCTPEKGVIDAVEGGYLRDEMRERLVGHAVNLDRMIGSAEYQRCQNNNPRKQAKARSKYLVQWIVDRTGIDEVQVRRNLYSSYVVHRFAQNPGALRQLMGPVFNAQ